jgi:hemerythrin superfamily protein
MRPIFYGLSFAVHYRHGLTLEKIMQQTAEVNKNASKKTLNEKVDIVEFILEDHKPLKDLIKIMKNGDFSEVERFAAFEEFVPALIAHSKPEEKTLYVHMKKIKVLRDEALEGDVEHGLADQLIEEIKRTTDTDLKSARIKVLAELVEHHIEEEEEMFPEFRNETKDESRAELGNKFMELKVRYLADGAVMHQQM